MVGIPTNAHKPPFGERLKTRDHIVHIVHKLDRRMATWHQPASHRVMWTLPTLPPTKVLHRKDCKYRAAVAFCFLAEGPG